MYVSFYSLSMIILLEVVFHITIAEVSYNMSEMVNNIRNVEKSNNKETCRLVGKVFDSESSFNVRNFNSIRIGCISDY